MDNNNLTEKCRLWKEGHPILKEKFWILGTLRSLTERAVTNSSYLKARIRKNIVPALRSKAPSDGAATESNVVRLVGSGFKCVIKGDYGG